MSTPYHIEDRWCRLFPILHRMMADPELETEFPRVGGDLSLEEACSIWETLHYLLRALLGWRDPGAGLSWWYATGRDVSVSPHLALVNRIWNSVDKLDYYAAWAWSEYQTEGPFPNDEWRREFRNRPVQQGNHPGLGGSNPLHLGHSDHFGWDSVKPAGAKLHHDLKRREAVLVVNHFGAWRRDLEKAGDTLPDLGNRSWHVEVFDRQVGFLGKFRRSRETGIWFQGRHSVHVRGQSAHGKEGLS